MCRVALLFLFLVSRLAADDKLVRQDFTVAGDPGIQVFVREVRRGKANGGLPILLIHGARVAGLASFDLPVEGGSLAGDLAERGFDVFVMDVRGYGASTRPKEMNEPPAGHPPLVRSNDAVHDIGAVVNWIWERTHQRVALFGWATGGQWAGHYASLYSENLSALIVLNSLYSGNSPQPIVGHGSDLEDPNHPGMFNSDACGAYRLNDAKSLFGAWDRSIPDGDKDLWRDPVVAKAYAQAALASDPTSGTRNPPSFRSPCGAMEDGFYLAVGRQLWDASLITIPTLILASERDFWSRPADRELLVKHLVHSPGVKTVLLKDATHFVHLDRPQHGREQLLEEIAKFVRSAIASNQGQKSRGATGRK